MSKVKRQVLEWELPSFPRREFPVGEFTGILRITGGRPKWATLVSHGQVVPITKGGEPRSWPAKRVRWNLTALKSFTRQYAKLGKMRGLGTPEKPSKAWLEFRALIEHHRPLLDLVRQTDGGIVIPGLENAPGSARKALLGFLRALAGAHSEGIGAPLRTRSLSPVEQTLAETIRRKGKGTERGSVRMISSQIAEKRGYSLRTEGRKTPTIARAVKRHLRRKGI